MILALLGEITDQLFSKFVSSAISVNHPAAGVSVVPVQILFLSTHDSVPMWSGLLKSRTVAPTQGPGASVIQ